MSVILPAGFTSRSLNEADAEAVVELIRANERHHFGESYAEVADVRSDWAMPGFVLATDTVAIHVDDRLVGYAAVAPTTYQFVDVHPEYLGRGLGSALLDWAIDLARSRGASECEQYIPEPDQAAAAILSARQYEQIYTSWILRLANDVTIAHRELDPSITVRQFVLDDAKACFQVVEDAFNEWESRRPHTFEEWTIANLQRDGANPDYFRVAERDGQVVGACMVHDYGEATFVHQLAVRSDLRGTGVGQELLASAFEAGRERGRLLAELSTDTRTGALGLYEKLGMHITSEFTTFKKVF